MGRTPDAAYANILSTQNTLPSIVLEVGFAESLAQLHHMACEVYLPCSVVQMVICIKADFQPQGARSPTQHSPSQDMLAVVYAKDESGQGRFSTRVLRFGSAASEELDRQLDSLPDLTGLPREEVDKLVVPARIMWAGVETGVPVERSGGNAKFWDCEVDLRAVREEVLEALCQMTDARRP